MDTRETSDNLRQPQRPLRSLNSSTLVNYRNKLSNMEKEHFEQQHQFFRAGLCGNWEIKAIVNEDDEISS